MTGDPLQLTGVSPLVISKGTSPQIVTRGVLVPLVFSGSAKLANSAPTAPTNLVATAISSSAIDLAWEDNATTESAYEVQRSLDGSNWTVLTTSLPPDTESYSDTGLSASTLYYYRVRALLGSLASDWSNTASATTDAEYYILDLFEDTPNLSLVSHPLNVAYSGGWVTLFGAGALRIGPDGSSATGGNASGGFGNSHTLTNITDLVSTSYPQLAAYPATFAGAFNMRVVDGSNRWQITWIFNALQTQIDFRSIIGGSVVTRAIVFGAPVSLNIEFKLHCESLGTTHSVYLNDVLVGSYTESGASFPYGFYVGYALSYPADVKLNWIRVDPV